MIHQETIEEIKNRLDTVDVIGDYLTLKKVGSNYRALSPFTNEKTPSFYVFPRSDTFKDFSSGKSGDAFTFLMEHEGMSYVEAVKHLAQKYGIMVKETYAKESSLDKSVYESLYVVMSFANHHYMDNLFNHNEGKKVGLHYLLERRFNEKIIRRFELGYAVDSWSYLSTRAKEEGYEESLLEKTGLIVKKGDVSYDRFRGRIIFPIHNVLGKVVAFGARILREKKTQPKYINSPATEIYDKSHTLYGLYQAKDAIRKEDNCYLVEGYTDVIALHFGGFDNTVSSSGTSFTAEQAQLIKRFTVNVTILFDGDKAGIMATMRGIDVLLRGGLNVYVVSFPHGDDPDSYLKKVGTAQFSDFLHKARRNFIAFKISPEARDVDYDPIQKAEKTKSIIATLAQVPDVIHRATYLKEAARLLALDEQIMHEALLEIIEKEQKNIGRVERKVEQLTAVTRGKALAEKTTSPLNQITEMIQQQERETIRLLLSCADEMIEDQTLLAFVQKELQEVDFTDPICRKIILAYEKASHQHQLIGNDYFINHEDMAVRETVVTLSQPLRSASPNWIKKYNIHFSQGHIKNQAYINILRLKLRVIQLMAEHNKEKIKVLEQANHDNEELDNLLAVQINLDNVKQNIAKRLGAVVVR